MRRRWHWIAMAFCFCAWCVFSLSGSISAALSSDAPTELMFVPVRIDAPAHNPANHTYWFGPYAECASVLDIDGDGKLDIASGRNFFIAPKWTRYADFRDGADTNGPDVDDNHELPMDVNNDGRTDILASGWMRKAGLFWYENPGKLGVKWAAHTMIEADGVEAFAIGNLSGRQQGRDPGPKDVLLNYFGRRPDRPLIWWEHLNQEPWFKQHTLGPPDVGVSHGNGIGDINGDGREDVVTTTGWFEAPPSPTEDKWIWHPDWIFRTPEGRISGAGQPVLITDVNSDGMNDIIWGSDHQYGLAWLEQKIVDGKRSFVQHFIETDYPTLHTMALADLDADGKLELITGKQLLAHNGGDPGGFEPTFVFYYKFQNGQFERHIVSYNYLTP
jgi:hypothetical protein